MSNKPTIPEGFTPIEPDEIMSNFQKNIDHSILQPNFDFEKTEQEHRKQIDNLPTFEDRANYASKVFNKGSVWKPFLITIVCGLILLAFEYHRAIWDFILSLIF